MEIWVSFHVCRTVFGEEHYQPGMNPVHFSASVATVFKLWILSVSSINWPWDCLAWRWLKRNLPTTIVAPLKQETLIAFKNTKFWGTHFLEAEKPERICYHVFSTACKGANRSRYAHSSGASDSMGGWSLGGVRPIKVRRETIGNHGKPSTTCAYTNDSNSSWRIVTVWYETWGDLKLWTHLDVLRVVDPEVHFFLWNNAGIRSLSDFIVHDVDTFPKLTCRTEVVFIRWWFLVDHFVILHHPRSMKTVCLHMWVLNTKQFQVCCGHPLG